ncbi:hypothetical protein MUK42_18902 [Musa troglodytarum]|uniref:Uncharacterized protein n=1 Tax=Musa troglodytarum TaxID=320322 RepID=A0A9E7FMT9_9LILI|nr:hypothetical protein MUK42_18902 [Musa troglodytarum]URD98740.1 hypothetical protein MUK42_18902 [Musa troglodytarum]URD98742.1 hypothetical protein MUK42_18902 [Musa troglodytarum]URD98743.1 hypothetical protein MUK42_18902 [Musa troglodytarum]URD98744.1 hypothetical protein MUK42_18902 [Musa troglodytarum]
MEVFSHKTTESRAKGPTRSLQASQVGGLGLRGSPSYHGWDFLGWSASGRAVAGEPSININDRADCMSLSGSGGPPQRPSRSPFLFRRLSRPSARRRGLVCDLPLINATTASPPRRYHVAATSSDPFAVRHVPLP